MKRFAAMLLMAAFLSACAAPRPAERDAEADLAAWAVGQRERAIRGEILWSSYYLEVYARLGALPATPGNAIAMASINSLIPVARSYERGSMSREEFENARRQAQVNEARERAAATEAIVRAIAPALILQQAQPAPAYQVPPVRAPVQTNCTRDYFTGNYNCTSY